MAEMQSLTHSRIQTFKTCAKKHWYAYEQLIRPIRTSDVLSRGSAFHNALETYDLTAGTPAEKLNAGLDVIAKNYATTPAYADSYEWACQGWTVATMFQLHCQRCSAVELEVLATEQAYNIPLINPETGRASRNFTLAGKIDRVVALSNGQVAIQEYKTTKQDIAPEADYWKRLGIDSQISGYVIAGRYLGYEITAALYDATRFPDNRPARATPEDKRKYTKDGALYANQRDADEAPEAFAERLSAVVSKQPDKFFRMEIIARQERDLIEHQYDTWAMQELIRKCQISGHWPRNAGACLTFYGRCPYFDLCVSGWEPSHGLPEGFRKAETPHEELAAPGGS